MFTADPVIVTLFYGSAARPGGLPFACGFCFPQLNYYYFLIRNDLGSGEERYYVSKRVSQLGYARRES
jgi:hypothetical protein